MNEIKMNTRVLLLVLASFFSVAVHCAGDIRVLDSNDQPVRDASISVFPVDNDSGKPGVGGRTDSNGIFRVERLRGVDCNVSISPSLIAPYSGRDRIRIPEESDEVVTIRAERLRSIYGRVINSSGEPLEHIRVIFSLRSEGVGTTTKSGHTNKDGQFQIPFLPADLTDFEIYGVGQDHVIERTSISSLSEEELVLVAKKKKTTDVQFRLVYRGSTEEVVIPYEGSITFKGPVSFTTLVEGGSFNLRDVIPGRYMLEVTRLEDKGYYLGNPTIEVTEETEIIDIKVNKLSAVSFMVKDSDTGKAISDAYVFVVQDGKQYPGSKTNDEGNVELNLPVLSDDHPGRLFVHHPSYLPLDIPLPRADHTVGLSRGLTFEGIVTDRDGKPIANALVTGIPLGGVERVTETEDSGVFVLQNLPAGALTLVVRAEGYAPISSKVHLPFSEKFEASLGPGVPVTIQIEVGLSEIDEEAGLLLLDERTMSPVGVLPATSGTSHELQLNPGKYTVLYWLEEGFFRVDRIEVEGQETIRINIEELGEKVPRPL